MQLTPRSLVLILGACMAAGLVLGIATVVRPGSGASATTPDPSSSAPGYSPADLGDASITYPPPPSPAATKVATPDVVDLRSSVPTPGISEWPMAAEGSGAGTPSPSASGLERPTASPNPRTTPTRKPTSASAKVQPAPQPSPPTTSKGNPSRTTQSAPRPSKRATPRPLDGWQAPSLGVGVTDISAPGMSSGARASVLVGCEPSSACAASGSSLTITAEAVSVMVSWTAPAKGTWRSWSVSRAFRP